MATTSDFFAKASAKKVPNKIQKKIDRSNSPTRPWETEAKHTPSKIIENSSSDLNQKSTQKNSIKPQENDSSRKKLFENQPTQINLKYEIEKTTEEDRSDVGSENVTIQNQLSDTFYEKVFKIFAEKELNCRQMKIISGIIIAQDKSTELIPISNNDWQSLLKTKHVKWVQKEIKKLIADQIVVKVTGQSGLSKSSYGLNHKNF